MFQGFSQEALDFLLGIRLNNNKEWFEERKSIYTEKIYEPLKELGAELYAPYEETDGMMYKVGRIYRDANFPPYLHYRDTMWIYVRYDAWYWNKTPTLFFELSPEGAEFGFRIEKPEAAVMERFRSQLTEDCKPFLNMVNDAVEKYGLAIGGEEYKMAKKCTVPEAEEFFRKKGLSLSKKVSGKSLFSRRVANEAVKVFKGLREINDYFHEIVEINDLSKALEKGSLQTETAETDITMVKAPDVDFMW